MRSTLIKMLVALLLPFQGKAETPEYLIENLRVEDGLTSNHCSALLYDRDGFIWVGCPGTINRYDGFRFKTYDIPSNILVHELYQDEDGTILAVCLRNDGAFRYDSDSDSFVKYSDWEHLNSLRVQLPYIGINDKCSRVGKWAFGGKVNEAIVKNLETGKFLYPDWTTIRGSARSRDGMIWLATNSGILVVDDDLNIVKRIQKSTSGIYSIFDNALYGITVDRFGGIWVTSYLDGMFHITPNDALITHHKPVGREAGSHRVKGIAEDRDGYIWLGTEDSGLVRYDRERDTYTGVPIPSDSRNVINLYCDKDSLWMSTFEAERSFCRIHTRTFKGEIQDSIPKRLTNPYELGSASIPNIKRIYGKACDAKGNIWATISNGILFHNAKASQTHRFTSRDGIPDGSFNFRSLYFSSDSLLFAGFSDGFITFDPQKMVQEDESTPITVLGFPEAEGGSTARIPAKDNSLSLQALTLDFRTPRRSWLQYRMDECVPEWTDVEEGFINIINIPTGRHTLQIRALTGDGSKVSGTWERTLRILPPPALSWWAILLYIIALAILIISISRAISYQTILSSKIKLARNIAEQMRQPLVFMQIQMETLLEHFRSSRDTQAKNDIEEMSRNFEKVNLMMDELAELRSPTNVDKFIAGEEPSVKIEIPFIQRFDTTLLLITAVDERYDFLFNILHTSYNLVRAKSAAEATRTLDSEKISLVIVDDDLDGVNSGVALCREIKQNEDTSYKPVIILAPSYDISSRINAISCGADAYLAMPAPKDLLIVNINSILENRSAIRKHYSEHPAVDIVSLESKSPDSVLLQKIDRFIRYNLSNENLRVEDVAHACSVSIPKLQSKMKSMLEMSAAQYMLHCRLKKATELLKDKNIPIADVSQMTGFTSHSYFTSCFRRHFGCTPMQFREKD